MLGNEFGEDTPDLDFFRIVRFNANGQPDPTFSGDGIYDYSISTSGRAQAIATYPNGDFAVGGKSFANAVAVRVENNATSTTQGATTSGSNCVFNALAVRADTKVAAAGDCGGTSPFIGRYTDTPVNPDTGFAGSGFTTAAGRQGSYNAVVPMPDGTTFAAGYQSSPVPNKFLVFKYAADGTKESSFTDGSSVTGGIVTVVASDWQNQANALAPAPDGKVVVGGQGDFTATGSTQYGIVVRLNANGSVDGSFGAGGKVVLQANSAVRAIAVQPNGKVVAAGSSNVGGIPQPAVWRLTASGQLDETFAPGGVRVGIPTASAGVVYGMSINPDGKILAGMRLESAGIKYLAVARFNGGEVPTGSGVGAKPKAKISSPTKSKLKAKKFKSIAGSATDATKVQIAVLKTDKTLLKKKKRCSQLSSPRAKFKKVKAIKKKCEPVKWLDATGTGSWKFKLKKTLPVAKYTIYVRASGAGGTSTPLKKSLKLTK